MKNYIENIKKRKSVRTFDGQALRQEDMEKLLAFAETASNPFGIPVTFKMLDAEKHNLNSPVIAGTNLYIGAKIENVPHANEAFGYAFESFVLYAQSLGIGTTWIAGTMNRSAFEDAMELSENQMMPCVTPLGYPSSKKSMKENIMRKAIKADERIAFEKLFFKDDFSTPLTEDASGALKTPLEMVRLAPSAVNKQPWRVVVTEDAAHFYLSRTKGYPKGKVIDTQKVDVGIAMCHFASAAEELGIKIEFTVNDPQLTNSESLEYIASYIILK